MVKASAENHWELRIERLVPLKRHVAYRVMRTHIRDWWYHPSLCLVSNVLIDWRSSGAFRMTDATGNAIQDGIIHNLRHGSYFQMTDAFVGFGLPAKPSMIGLWGFETTPIDHPSYGAVRAGNGDCSTHFSVIRHFSEADYLRSRAQGFEKGWNDAADRLVKLCNARPRPI